MRRFMRGMLMWGLLGAATGAYLMVRNSSRRGMRYRTRRLERTVQRAAARAISASRPRLDAAIDSGREMVDNTMKTVRR